MKFIPIFDMCGYNNGFKHKAPFAYYEMRIYDMIINEYRKNTEVRDDGAKRIT